MFLGRNEENGLRCVYHGWKFDVDGNCTDMPNEPIESRFKEKVFMKSYPTLELGRSRVGLHGAKREDAGAARHGMAQSPGRASQCIGDP